MEIDGLFKELMFLVGNVSPADEESAARLLMACATIKEVQKLVVAKEGDNKRESIIGNAALETMKVLMAAPDYITLGQWKALMKLAATEPEMNWAAEIAKLAKEGSAMWLPADLYDALAAKGLISKLGKDIRRSAPTTKIEAESSNYAKSNVGKSDE